MDYSLSIEEEEEQEEDRGGGEGEDDNKYMTIATSNVQRSFEECLWLVNICK
jgi:hypothetical protein